MFEKKFNFILYSLLNNENSKNKKNQLSNYNFDFYLIIQHRNAQSILVLQNYILEIFFKKSFCMWKELQGQREGEHTIRSQGRRQKEGETTIGSQGRRQKEGETTHD
jgi:hypothetical protein